MKQKFYPQVNHLLDSYVHSNVILFEGNCDKEEIRVKGLRIALRSGQAVWWTTKICILPKPGVNPNRIPFIPYNHDLDSWSPGTLSLLPGHGFPSGASSFSALQLHKSWGLGFCCCSVAHSCLTLCDPMDWSTAGFPVPHHLPKFAQVHVHCIAYAIQLFHSLAPSSPSALNLSQHQETFQWVGRYQMTKILEFQLQHQWLQWIFRVDFP